MTDLRWSFYWAVALSSTCLALCVLTAVSLFHQQEKIAGVLRENVASRRAAGEMEECLNNVITLEDKRIDEVAPLHDRLRGHMKVLRKLSDEREEKRLADQMESGFADYMRRWNSLPPLASGRLLHEEALREAMFHLETDVLKPCSEFRLYNDKHLEETTQEHERVLRQLAWGMGGVATLGGAAGLVFGYGVARSLNRTIRRLQVQIRDAAGKIDPKLPEIVLTGEGNLDGLHEEIEDLTSRIEKVVQQLHEREREVMRAEQLAAVGQLAAGVGHEIRNPLTSIKMLAQAGIEDGQMSLTAVDLRIIESEVRRMERSLQTFLDFARPLRPERRPVNLISVIETVIGLTRGRAEKQHVTTRLEAPQSGVVLTVDASQFQQVMVNLVLNSLDAMPTGGSLNIAVWQHDPWVEVEVADTGSGISEEVLPKIFQPFVSSKETGLGLGLVISRRIMEDHGGTIEAANRIGGGAVIRIRFPAHETAEQAARNVVHSHSKHAS